MSATVTRFFYIRSNPQSRVLHLAGGRMAGDLTYCGRPLQKGWHWYEGNKEGLQRCKACEASRAQ